MQNWPKKLCVRHFPEYIYFNGDYEYAGISIFANGYKNMVNLSYQWTNGMNDVNNNTTSTNRTKQLKNNKLKLVAQTIKNNKLNVKIIDPQKNKEKVNDINVNQSTKKITKKIRKATNIFILYLIFICISTPKLLLLVNVSFFKIP